jgi:hypothetical protein
MVTAALVNSSWKLDAEVPSPGQFDHVIGYLPQGMKVVWLDTTPEVAPFGYLVPRLRDKEAFVMSARLLRMRDEARDRQVLSARRIRFPRGLCHCRRRLVHHPGETCSSWKKGRDSSPSLRPDQQVCTVQSGLGSAALIPRERQRDRCQPRPFVRRPRLQVPTESPKE